MVGEVTALDHEVLDDSVEGRSFITKALLASGKSSEVLSGLGDSAAVEAKDNAAELLIAVLNVEVHLLGDLGTLGSLNVVREEDQDHSEEEGNGNEESTEIDHLAKGVMKSDRCDRATSMDWYEGEREESCRGAVGDN